MDGSRGYVFVAMRAKSDAMPAPTAGRGKALKPGRYIAFGKNICYNRSKAVEKLKDAGCKRGADAFLKGMRTRERSECNT